jgi:uracil-DNA glycosylase family protein
MRSGDGECISRPTDSIGPPMTHPSSSTSTPGQPWTGSAADFLPEDPTLDRLREAARGCRGCDLYLGATQTVFGEGSKQADVMLVGEQPGDKEDLAGEPFVGPSGLLLDAALKEAGIDRSRAYVTNAVKHFKWRPVGKRRLHEKPNQVEITACRPWLEAELREVEPLIVVALGATAAQALLGASFRVTRDRGRFFDSDLAPLVTATVHPSSILRSQDRATDMAAFVRDLTLVAEKLHELRAAG